MPTPSKRWKQGSPREPDGPPAPSSEGERLQKVMAHAGLGSRRAIEDLIRAGRIRVNGTPARLGDRVDSAKDVVELDGSRVPLDVRLVYYLLNKPPGVVSTADDPHGRTTVLDVVDTEARVWPVGRLDADSQGALILTNDGDLTMRLTHPRHEVAKTYVVEVEGAITREALATLRRGVPLDDDRPPARARVRILEKAKAATLMEMTIAEGRNRQIRHMCENVGFAVRSLVRTQIGPLQLGRLKPGQWRRLSPIEVRDLYRASGA